MKITKEIALILVEESPAFRQFLVDEAFKSGSGETYEEVRRICLVNKPNKIAAIKTLREYSIGREDAFRAAFPNLAEYFHSIGDPAKLCLSSAKKIVETFI